MHRRGATTLPPLLAAAALLLLGGAHAADYCDGHGGLTQTQRDYSDPSCQGSCSWCSAAQVAAAMAALPDDRDVQFNGCLALGNRASNGGASRAAAVVAAGGAERVTAAMAHFPDDNSVQ